MTDRETFEAMLKRAGILYAVDGNEITIEADGDDDSKNAGYPGFYSVFFFREDGALERIGSWE